MPYGSFGGGMTGAGAGTTGGGLGAASPYLQMALAAVQALRGGSSTEAIGNKFQGMYGTDVNLPGQPSSQSTGRRVGRAVGTAALNAVPVAGPFLSQAASIYGSDVDAKARQNYVKKLLARNPQITDPGAIGLRSEYVPQTNMLARQAESQGSVHPFVQKHVMPALESRKMKGIGYGDPLLHAGGALMRGIGHKVMGSESRQKKREAEIHKKNVERMFTFQSQKRNKAIAAQAAGQQAKGAGGPSPEALSFLMQVLGPQIGGIASQLAAPRQRGTMMRPGM